MTGWRAQPPWVWAIVGAVGIVILLGYTGNLTSARPIDRLLNPDARNYWESPNHYIQNIFEFCSQQSSVTGEPRTFKVCYDHSIDGAIERGYISERDVARYTPGP